MGFKNGVVVGPVSFTGGTASISTDAAAGTVNIGTGAAPKTITVGSTNTTSSLALKYGTSDMNIASASGTVMSLLDTGEVTKPLQPFFSANTAVNQFNATGDGTIYTVQFENLLQSQGSGWDGTQFFTAPVTGIYQFNIAVIVVFVAANHTDGSLILVVNGNPSTAAQYWLNNYNPGAMRNSGNSCSFNGSVTIEMSAGDVANVWLIVSGGAKDITVLANRAIFNGVLLC